MKLLIVDDEENIRDFLKVELELSGYAVFTSSTGREAIEVLKNKEVDVCFLDIILPDMNGLDVLSEIRQIDSGIKVIIITALNDLKLAVRATRLGAYDYITKPFSLDEIEIAAESAIDALRNERKLDILEREVSKCLASEFRGTSPSMRELYVLIDKAAKLERGPFLITGETGTGKNLTARAIHNMSRRATGPFVSVQGTAIPENIFESELFGHEKGAFTDAKFMRQGFFELAKGGAIFFDEIGDISPGIQSKLLGVIEERKFRRLGGNKELSADVTIIAATNKDLSAEIKKGRFREDLYYRLMVFPIHMPSLRERKEDIPGLAEFFLKRSCQEFRVAEKSFSQDVINAFLAYAWPGNIREMKNIVERIAILHDSTLIGIEQFPAEIQNAGKAFVTDIKMAVHNIKEAYEKNYISDLLIKHKGNVTRAAQDANKDRGSFQRLMRKYSIRSEAFRE